MGLVSPSQSNSGDTIEASDINDPINQLAAVINGNVDANNLADSAVTTAKHADGSVTPNKLTASTGASWVWQSWTPTWTNLTVGNGTNASTYCQIGKVVHFRLKFTLGSTSVMGSGPIFTLPVTSISYGSSYSVPIGQLGVRDDSAVANQPGIIYWVSTTTAEPDLLGAAGTYANAPGLSSTVPFTWTTSDVIQAMGMYEAA